MQGNSCSSNNIIITSPNSVPQTSSSSEKHHIGFTATTPTTTTVTSSTTSSSSAVTSFISGTVVPGFGRGSKELGCPTANLESHVVSSVIENLDTGVYYGYAVILDDRQDGLPSKQEVYGMVSSLGFNPHFGNDKKSLEVHILHSFDRDFYGATVKVALIGKIRDEKKFASLQDLIQAIQDDKDFSKNTLDTRHAEFEGVRRQLLSLPHHDR